MSNDEVIPVFNEDQQLSERPFGWISMKKACLLRKQKVGYITGDKLAGVSKAFKYGQRPKQSRSLAQKYFGNLPNMRNRQKKQGHVIASTSTKLHQGDKVKTNIEVVANCDLKVQGGLIKSK